MEKCANSILEESVRGRKDRSSDYKSKSELDF